MLLPAASDIVDSTYTSPLNLVLAIVRGFNPSQLLEPPRNLSHNVTCLHRKPNTAWSFTGTAAHLLTETFYRLQNSGKPVLVGA